ncbi:MAG: TrbI/VirB10 family protein [Opitutaceae bacterium]|jgi:hypothetical protein|nr:TrbI/VirB10 family protein [Opitutaceae bacterium]
MTFDRDFLTSPTGQVVLVAAVLLLGVIVAHRYGKAAPAALPAAKPAPAAPLPQTLIRGGVKFPAVARPAPPSPSPVPGSVGPTPAPGSKAPVLPLAVFVTAPEAPAAPVPTTAPFGRLVPCQTVIALESNRLETPIIGLVTEDVWHDGKCVIPAGTEVHGRAALDRARERIAAQGQWRFVWRTKGADNGLELAVDALVLDREFDGESHMWGEHDGSAGLRGQVVRTGDDRELKLFAASFLATATSALQDSRLTNGLLGEASAPAATARNALLAGTGAILREYAQSMREAIARDGFYLRVPAGKPFYLYVTQTLDRSQARRAPPIASSSAPPRP